jgi:hypothetical protein
MAAFTATSSVPVQLENVNKKLPVLFEKDDTFFSTIEKRNGEVVSDTAMRIPLHIRPGGYFGKFDPDGGAMGRGSGPKLDKATIQTVPFKMAFEFTAKADWATDSGRKATISAVKKIVADSMPEFRRNIDAQCLTAGDCVLGTIESVISTAGGKDTYQMSTTDGIGARLLRFGQKVNVYLADLSAVVHATGAEVEIDWIDYENNQIRVAANVTGSAATNKILISGASGATPTSIFGVPYHHNNASTGTWLGLDRATYPEIRANRVNANGQAFALPYARLAVTKIGTRLGSDRSFKPTAWLNPCQSAAYEELGQLVSVIQKQASDEKLNLYFGKGMQLAGCPIREHFSWNKTRIDFIVGEIWGRTEMHPMGFYKINGNYLFPVYHTDGGIVAANVFYLVAMFNLYLDTPPAASYVDGLAVPSGY